MMKLNPKLSELIVENVEALSWGQAFPHSTPEQIHHSLAEVASDPQHEPQTQCAHSWHVLYQDTTGGPAGEHVALFYCCHCLSFTKREVTFDT